MISNPHPCFSTTTVSSPFCPSLSPAVYTNTWFLTIQFDEWIDWLMNFSLCTHSGSIPQPRLVGEKEKLPWEHLRAKKLAILIRSAQLLVLVYILVNTIHCVPSEDSVANIPAAVWLTPQQLWAGKWKIFKEEKNILVYLVMQVSIIFCTVKKALEE